jgi:ubiquinone/menaquinone biosynthesis C-methylase UbiE
MSFDNYAKTWDTDERIDRAKVVANKISNSIDINKDYSAMEFGCGTGLVSFNLYDKFKNITLVDSSKGMIDILESKIDNYKVNNMFPYHLDISNGSSIDTKFDVIYNSMVLHHIDNTEDITKTFYELLNKDGYLCIVDLDEEDGSFHKNYPDYDGHNGFNQEALKNILINSGFKDIEANTFFYGEKVIEGEKVNYSLFIMKGRKY